MEVPLIANCPCPGPNSTRPQWIPRHVRLQRTTRGRGRHGRAGRGRPSPGSGGFRCGRGPSRPCPHSRGHTRRSARPVPRPTCPPGARGALCGWPAHAAGSRPPAPGFGAQSSSGGPWRRGSRCSPRAEHAQQLRDGRDFVGPAVHRGLGQHQAVGLGPGPAAMTHLQFTAAHRNRVRDAHRRPREYNTTSACARKFGTARCS